MAASRTLVLRFPSFWGWTKPECEHFINTRAVPALNLFEKLNSCFVHVLLPGATLLWLEEHERFDVFSRLHELSVHSRGILIETLFSDEELQLSAAEEEAERDTYRRWCKYRKLALRAPVDLSNLPGAEIISLAQEHDFERLPDLLKNPSEFTAFTDSAPPLRKRINQIEISVDKGFEFSREIVAARLKHFTERHQQAFGGLFKEDRLLKAEGHYYLTRLVPALSDPYVRRRMNQALISAQVEIDFLERPEVDPNEGWIQFHEQPQFQVYQLQSQLIEMLFKAKTGGALTLDYKPRKTNLLSVLDKSERAGFTDFYVEIDGDVERLTEEQLTKILPPPPGAFSEACEFKLLKRNPSAVSIRFEREFSLTKGSLLSNFSFHFKSGIGAHLTNSTTGFSVEYWLEAVDKPQALMGIQVPIMLPSSAVEGMSAIALQCVGGVSNLRRSMEEPFFISAQTIPGGLYGLRLIDGVDGFVIDFRSAKGLLGIYHRPVYSAPAHPDEAREYQGSLFYFLSAAHRIFGDDKANTLFVSIV